jgi:hypothetical protein
MKIVSFLATALPLLLHGTAARAHGEEEEDPHRALTMSRQTTAQRNYGGGGYGGGGWSYTLAVFGDWPYAQVLLDNHMRLVDSVNGYDEVDVVVHLGDIHSGSMPCMGAGYSGVATVTTVSSNLSGLALPVGTYARAGGSSIECSGIVAGFVTSSHADLLTHPPRALFPY